MRRHLPQIALLLTLIGFAGPPPPVTHPVHGTVLQGGKPLEDGVVEFQPLQESIQNAHGEIKPDGSYKLGIVHDGKRFEGAVAGEYRVTVLFMAKKETDKRPPVTLEKTYKVVEGDNTINIELASQ